MKLLKVAEKYLICILLVIVALIQLYHSQFGNLTPWKGGGFGMFSTNKKANITAIGYTASGDSVIINVVGSKFDIPISRNFLTSTNNFPREDKLKKLSKLILYSYLKPSSLKMPSNIDSRSADIISGNSKFYDAVYLPTYYQNKRNAKLDNAIQVEKVKIVLYQTDFFEEGLLYKKRYVSEFVTQK